MPRNVISTERFQISIDSTTMGVLKRMAKLGIFGKNHADVAYWILREWIVHNEEPILKRRKIALPVAKG